MKHLIEYDGQVFFLKGEIIMFWIGVFIGATLIGSPMGFMVAAFCAAAKGGDKHFGIEHQRQKNT